MINDTLKPRDRIIRRLEDMGYGWQWIQDFIKSHTAGETPTLREWQSAWEDLAKKAKQELRRPSIDEV